jgi:Flp pilus assembly protein TadD
MRQVRLKGIPGRQKPHQAALLALLTCLLTACGQPRQQAELSLEARLRLAEAVDAQGDGDATFAVVRDAYLHNPNDRALRSRLVVIAERSSRLTEAAEALRLGLLGRGRSADGFLALGRVELQAGNSQAARDACREALALDPRNIAALGLLGIAHDNIGEHGPAQEAYRAGLTLAPQDWGLRNNLGLSLLLSGRADEAVAALEPSERDTTAPRRMRHNLALALAAAQQRDRLLRLIRMEVDGPEADAIAERFFTFAQDISSQSRSLIQAPGSTSPAGVVAR